MSWGLPWDGESGGPGYAGQAYNVWYRDGDQRPLSEAEPWERTCPQYYARSPFYLSLWQELGDYQEGRTDLLGELSEAHLTYLRCMDAEHQAWRNYWDAKLMPDPPKKK